MAKLLQTIIPILSSIAFLLAATNTALSQTTSFIHDFYEDLNYQGDAHFPSNITYLRMTKTDDSGNPLSFSVGRVVYYKPVQFWETGAQVDFETTLKFIIKPKSGDTNPADGFAFFIEPLNSTIGFTGGSYGIFDSSGKRPSVFAVEFDIHPNPEIAEPRFRHVGIDIESNISKNTTNVGDAILGQEVTARINYAQATKLISVHVTAGLQTFEVSYVFDLSTILPQQVQIGVSAATGGSVAVHDLISWYFTSTIVHRVEEEGGNIRQYV